MTTALIPAPPSMKPAPGGEGYCVCGRPATTAAILCSGLHPAARILWDPAWRIFNLAAVTIEDPVLSRPGTLPSATLAHSARLARWQAAHTDGYWEDR
jgi:hypothetical protein